MTFPIYSGAIPYLTTGQMIEVDFAKQGATASFSQPHSAAIPVRTHRIRSNRSFTKPNRARRAAIN